MSHIPFNRVKGNGKVELWDTGPKRPAAPEAPKEPDKSLKGPDAAAAAVEYEDACERYKQQLRDFAAAKRAFAEWHEVNGGPLKVELWGVDARHAMVVEPERFKLDLPKGQKPGKAQIEADERAAEEAEARHRAIANDPQFGQGATP